MLESLSQIQDLFNKTIDETKKDWSELKSYTDQMNRIEQSDNNMEMGGIKIKELNKSLSNMTKFLEGAFEEVNKSMENINKDINKVKKQSTK